MTVRQWVYDVIGFKADKEAELKHPVGSERIHQIYEKEMPFWAKTSERISAAFVDSAVTIYKRVFSLPAALEAIVWCDENLASNVNPFQSIYVLQSIVDRAQTPERIAWAIPGLLDHYRMELIDKGAFSVAKLRDYRHPSYQDYTTDKFD